jgi:hypothetical protein
MAGGRYVGRQQGEALAVLSNPEVPAPSCTIRPTGPSGPTGRRCGKTILGFHDLAENDLVVASLWSRVALSQE